MSRREIVLNPLRIISSSTNVKPPLQVARVNLVTAKSKRGDFQTYTIRIYDAESFNGASIFVMWKSGTMGEYAEGQVEAFESLVKKYGEEITFE